MHPKHPKYNPHTFDMNEYFAGERFVIQGIENDWDVPLKDLKAKDKKQKALLKSEELEKGTHNPKHIELRPKVI